MTKQTAKHVEKALALDDIETDPRCQTRIALDPDTVEAYAELYRDGVKLPPLDVFEIDGAPYLVDGFHRLAAMRQIGQGFARVRVVGRGDIEEATWAALAANHTHGLRRSRADKRKAVLMALESGIGVEQSTRVLARHLGVSHMTVSRIRAEWEAAPGVTKLQADDPDPTDPVDPGDPEGLDCTEAEVYPRRKPKPTPFEAFKKNVAHVERDVPRFYEAGSEVHTTARRLVELVRDRDPTVAA